jgi:hypothetical protein
MAKRASLEPKATTNLTRRGSSIFRLY